LYLLGYNAVKSVESEFVAMGSITIEEHYAGFEISQGRL
jgi:hypothetical protein